MIKLLRSWPSQVVLTLFEALVSVVLVNSAFNLFDYGTMRDCCLATAIVAFVIIFWLRRVENTILIYLPKKGEAHESGDVRREV